MPLTLAVGCSVKPEATSSMIEVLTPIWQRVLQLSSIQVDGDFFDLGGDDLLARELFTEIAQACHRELPPVTIYQARTIAALAALLEQPTALKFPALVHLKKGAKKPPVFIAHGLGGSVIDFFQTVRHIESDHPIYGIQAKGTDGLDAPLERIEDMAEFHLSAIRELQPHGPYALIGYSLGGLVALEMAQRLSENGEKVGLLAMLDAYPNLRHLSWGQLCVSQLAGSHGDCAVPKMSTEPRLINPRLRCPLPLRCSACAQALMRRWLATGRGFTTTK